MSGCKLHVHLWKQLKKRSTKKIKKPHKLGENSSVTTRLQKRLDIFIFLMIFLIIVIIFSRHCESLILTILVAPEIYARWHNKIIYGIFLITAWIKLFPQLLLMKDIKENFLALMWLMWPSGNLTSNLMRLLFFPKDLEMFLLQGVLIKPF